MKIRFLVVLLLLLIFDLKAQEVLLQENFQDWASIPKSRSIELPIKKKLSNGQYIVFQGYMLAVFPNHDVGIEGRAIGNDNPSSGCIVLTNITSYLELPDLESIGRLNIKANAFTNLSSFKLQVFKVNNWVDIPGSYTKVYKNVIKQFSFDLNFPSNTTIRICTNQTDSLNIWDVQVNSFIPTIPRLKTPENVSAMNVNSTSFQLKWDSVDNASSYDIRIYNSTGIVKVININDQQSPQVSIPNLLSGIYYCYKIISKGNGLTNTDSYSYRDTLDVVLPNRQPHTGSKIIFKFDDIIVNKGVSPSITTMKYLASENIKASYGVIALSCDSTAHSTFNQYINSVNDNGDNLIEIWNHGYDHKTYNSLPEFCGTGYNYQKSHFENATQLVLKNIGIQMNTFGAPWNESDTITNRVMSENSNYKVFLCTQAQRLPLTSSSILTLNHFVYMEFETGKLDFDFFLANYSKHVNNFSDYMILQGHPNSWKLESPVFNELKKIINFLTAQGCDFVLPYDYYVSQELIPPTDLKSNYDNGKKIKLMWKNNSDSQDFSRVERSTDLKSWILRGICNKDSASFTDGNISTDTILYYYRISATKKNQSKYSSILKVDLINTNIFESKSDNNHIRIYPNPCRQEVRIIFDFENSEFVCCDIYDEVGKFKKNLFEERFSVGISNQPYNLNLEPGVYYCRIRTSKNIYVSKIIVLNKSS